MKKYMLVMITDEGNQTVQFYDDYHKALDAYNICSVSLGRYCELYCYDKPAGYTAIM